MSWWMSPPTPLSSTWHTSWDTGFTTSSFWWPWVHLGRSSWCAWRTRNMLKIWASCLGRHGWACPYSYFRRAPGRSIQFPLFCWLGINSNLTITVTSLKLSTHFLSTFWRCSWLQELLSLQCVTERRMHWLLMPWGRGRTHSKHILRKYYQKLGSLCHPRHWPVRLKRAWYWLVLRIISSGSKSWHQFFQRCGRNLQIPMSMKRQIGAS